MGAGIMFLQSVTRRWRLRRTRVCRLEGEERVSCGCGNGRVGVFGIEVDAGDDHRMAMELEWRRILTDVARRHWHVLTGKELVCISKSVWEDGAIYE